MRNRNGARRLAVVTATAMVLTLTAGVPADSSAKAKAPALSASGKTIFTRNNFLLRVKKNSAKKIIKTTWSVNDGGANIVALSARKKASVRVLALNDPGEAKIRAKVKYKIGTQTKIKKLTCHVVVKEGTTTPSPVTPEPYIPTAFPDVTPVPTVNPTQTPVPQAGTVNYNASNSSFEITFNAPQQCSVNADRTDAAGSKQWVNSASKIVKINWQGSNNYLLPVSSVTMDSTGSRLAVFTDPGQMRLGSQFDITLTGFYGAGESTNNNIKVLSMTSPISSLMAAVDTNLTQPVVGSNKTVGLSVCFNQPMKSNYAFDRSPLLTGTQELGGWQANANQIAKVYEVVNGTTSSQALTVAGVTAYKPQADDGIERVVIDLGTPVTSGTHEYLIQLNGFSPTKTGGILGDSKMQTKVRFTPEALNINSGSFEKLLQTTTTNGEATDVILRLNMGNSNGNGTLMKKSDSRTSGWPSDYVSVKDSAGTALTVSYLKTTLSSNQIEIGVLGGRDSEKYDVQFSAGFPYAFLQLTSTRLIQCDMTWTVTANGASSSSSSTDTASYDVGTSYFVFRFKEKIDNIIAEDDVVELGTYWGETKAANMANLYDVTSSGTYDKNKPLEILPDMAILSTDAKTLYLHVPQEKLKLGKRYAIVLLGFVYESNYSPITNNEYYVTAQSTPTAGISIKSISAREEGSGSTNTVFRVQLSATFTDSVEYDEKLVGNYMGIWNTSASLVAEVYRIDNSVRTPIPIGTVAMVSGGSSVDIITTAKQTAGTFMIVLKGVRASGALSDATLTADYTLK